MAHPITHRKQSIANGWWAAIILLAAYAVSFLDRQVVSLLVEPIKHDLSITNTQIGILQGPAFGLFYAALGLPLGWLADRVHRVRLIAAAIAMWSVMTLCCGLANTFGGLLVARFGVGIGEAALVPAAISLLADLFKPAQRALPVSVFNCGVAVGAGLALTLGGVFIAFSDHGAANLPWVGAWFAARHAWQNVFVFCGVVGLPVAASVLFIAEPRSHHNAVPAPLHSIAAAWRHLVDKRRFFLPMLSSMACYFIIVNALAAWLPSLLRQNYGWSPAQTGHSLGLTIMAGALLGNVASGNYTNWLRRRGHVDATLRTMLTGLTLIAPLAVLTPLMATPFATLVGVACLYFFIALTSAVATIAFVEVSPPRLRGQVVALYLLIGNLFGLVLGPVSVGRLMDAKLHAASTVGGALALVCVVTAVPAVWLLFKARRAFKEVMIAE